jgi:FdhD protein
MKASKNTESSVLPLVQEEQFKLYVNGIYYSNFLCTPEAVKELVTGNLFTNGNISSLRHVDKIDIKGYKIYADISGSSSLENTGGGEFVLPALDVLKVLAESMFRSAEIYKVHGGIHCSALSDGERMIAFKEDIGRHNAFDKVVGEALLKGHDLNRLIYFTSGRVNQEVMIKASTCGFSLIVSRSICSSSAFRLAEKYGIKLIGRILTSEPVIYRG